MSSPSLTLCPHEWVMQSADTCICRLCQTLPTLWVLKPDGTPDVLYKAQPHQEHFHESGVPNLVAIGPRGTGKSLMLRMDCHLRAMQVPDFKYLMLRRRMPELKRSHLIYIDAEMRRLGGTFHHTDSVAKYPNGSLGFYGHLEDEASATRYLSAEYDLVDPDEIVTFTPDQLLKIASCIRVPLNSGRVGMLRGAMNKLGIGAVFVKQWFVDKDVSLENYPDYHPDDYDYQIHRFDDNAYIDREQYKKRLQNLPEHVRKAWLDDEWCLEGSAFSDFKPRKDGKPWHVIEELPKFRGENILGQSWVDIYRSIDWGYSPDPAVCHWYAVLPNKRTICFKERKWKETLAADVAKQIKRETPWRCRDTFCDPTMLIDDGKGAFGIGDIFEQNGVPLTPSVNKRDAYVYAIHDYLNTTVQDGQNEYPQIQILAGDGKHMGCPDLIKTLPQQQLDDKDPNKLADGDDHSTVSLAYFCLGVVPPARDPQKIETPRWMKPRTAKRRIH